MMNRNFIAVFFNEFAHNKKITKNVKVVKDSWLSEHKESINK